MVRVLVFDDSEYIHKLLTARIKNLLPASSVFCCYTFDEAIHVLEQHTIDLAIIDLLVPEKNGADLIHFLNKQSAYQDIKKVVCTSTSRNSLLKKSIEHVVDGYLHKDDLGDEFKRVLQKLKFVR